jgi:multisubunit Na+/H+ antiporter MnhB subunit
MVEWTSLAFNELWVLGAAVILAAFSLACYEAHRRSERLWVRLAGSGFQLWLFVGLALISLGAALTGLRWWERVLWGLLCAMSVWQVWAAWRESRTKGN